MNRRKMNKKNKVTLYNNKYECCGCTACYSVCTQNAIHMKMDIEGFLYPSIDKKKCIKCQRCVSVCPLRSHHKENGTRVLFINDEYSVGGAAKALGELVLELRKHGIESIVCTSYQDDFTQFLNSKGIKNIQDGHLGVMTVKHRTGKRIKDFKEYIYNKMRFLWRRHRAILYLEKNIDFSEINIIHTNSARNDIGCYLSKKYHIPHIVHLREFGEQDFDCITLRKNYCEYINRHSDLVVAVSKAVLASWRKKGIAEKQSKVLYDGVDFGGITYIEKTKNHPERLKIVFTGGICETKGQHIAIEALSLLPDEVKKNVTMDFVGWADEVYLKKLQDTISMHQLDKNVCFLGKRDDIIELLQKYDLGVMCSKSEGFGRVTVEYMYAGLGIIVPRAGACVELIKEQWSGLFFDRNNPKELAGKIMYYYYHRDKIVEYGEHAHHVACEKYSAELNAENVIKEYKKLLQCE